MKNILYCYFDLIFNKVVSVLKVERGIRKLLLRGDLRDGVECIVSRGGFELDRCVESFVFIFKF